MLGGGEGSMEADIHKYHVGLLAWRPHPFPHANKEERFSGRRAWYQHTKVMFPVNKSVDNEFHYVVTLM